jgi:hypothetical protein
LQGHKIILKSKSNLLNRKFHIDEFTSKSEPSGIVLCFSGSGKTKESYHKYERTVIPNFEKAWARLGQDLPIIFVYVTAPYDLQYSNFSALPSEKERWNQHVEEEILVRWPDLPLYVIGISGGILLALHGLHMNSRIVGIGGLGADNIPENIEFPRRKDGEPAWYLNLYYNFNDNVYNSNQSIVDKYCRDGVAVCNRFNGGHSTMDYIANMSFDGLIRFAINRFKP